MQSQAPHPFVEKWRKARELSNHGEWNACVQECKELLDEPTLSPYYRIDALVLIGGANDDWHEAEKCLDAAESIWWNIRRLWPEGSTTDGTDEVLAKFRVRLDKLTDVQREDPPEDAPKDGGDAADVQVAREEGENGLTELGREEAREADRLWEERMRHVDPATPAWQWTGATTPPGGRPPSFETTESRRLPGQSEEEYLRTVDPRIPASEWELDGKETGHPLLPGGEETLHSAMGTGAETAQMRSGGEERDVRIEVHVPKPRVS